MGARGPATIVLATDSVVPSGVGEHMLTLASALRQEHCIVLAFPITGAGQSFLVRAQNSGWETISITSDDAALAESLRSLSAALLHVHAGVAWEGHGLAAAGWRAGIPIIRTEHLPYVLTDERQKREHLLGIELIDRTVFVSEAAYDTYHRVGASGRRSVTIRNGISRPLPTCDRQQTRSLLGLADENVMVVTIARFTPQKGYGQLLGAAPQVLGKFPETRFILIGDGPGKAAMQGLAAEREIDAAMLFLGARDDIPDLLAAADIFVLPSLFEGLPLVILEAMAMALPIVATRIGGTLEALGADYPWLVEPGDSVALANALDTALGDAETRGALGQRNRQRYEHQFTAERMASETAALYRAVAAEGMSKA